VLNEANLLKISDCEAQLEALLRSLLQKVPFLKLVSLQKQPNNWHALKFSAEARSTPDWTAEVRAADQSWILVAEAKQIGQPRQIRTAALQLEHYLARFPETVPHYGLVLAPFISEQSARICEESGLGYADLAGNARLSFDNIFIETRSPHNPFRERREVKSLFAPRACRVLRVLLQGPLRSWKVVELAKKSCVSVGRVSAVRRRLIAQEWAIAEALGFRVSNPNAVLEAWAAADLWKARATVREYSLLFTDPSEIAKGLGDFLGDRRHAFTQWFAGWLRHPYTVPPIVTAYVEEFPDEATLEQKLLARRVEEGGRLRLVKPIDLGVFSPGQSVGGFTLASDVQIYLDLLAAGQRGDEQAKELRKWPDFAGGWKQ
jgi:hypothetical protein